MQPAQTPPEVERVVEGDEYFVEVRLDPKDLLPDLLAALGSSALLLGQTARYRNSNSPEARRDALETITRNYAVQQACIVRLPGSFAEDVSIALDEHCTEPDRCHAADCTNYAIDKSQYCGPHEDAYPCAVAR